MNKRFISLFTAFILLLSFSSCAVKPQTKTSIYGKWTTKGGALFEFTKDGRYAFYKDKNDKSDYYYKGPLKFHQGKDAMQDVSLTNEEFNRVYKKYTNDENNLYSLKLYFETLHSEGKDKSSAANKKDYMYYLFIISGSDSNKGIAIRLTDSYISDITRVK